MLTVADASSRRPGPSWWVPSLYFAEGLPMVTVSAVSAIAYKNLGYSNAEVAFHTGLLYLPWSLKPLWAPVVELARSKRSLVWATQLVMGVLLGVVAVALGLSDPMVSTLGLFWVLAFVSATHDMAADGLYIATMTARDQARFVGVQGVFWNLGRVAASGAMVTLAGILYSRGGSYVRAWAVVFGLLAAAMLVLTAWNRRVLPRDLPRADTPTADGAPTSSQTAEHGPAAQRLGWRVFAQVFATFVAKPGIAKMVAFVLLYRFAEGFLEKVGPLFMLDPREQGGLGLDNQTLGQIAGTVGTLALIGGGLLGGAFVARFGLRRSLFVLCVCLNVPNLTYVYLSQVQPTGLVEITVWVAIEKAGYGFGSAGHMLYMMQQIAPGPCRTAHYAFATALMGLGMMIPAALSGFVQERLGYPAFFVFVVLATLPSFVTTWFAPFSREAE